MKMKNKIPSFDEYISEDSAFGSGMMFGIPGPGPKKDTKGIPSDPKKLKGKSVGLLKNVNKKLK
jgi:hypothetical protein